MKYYFYYGKDNRVAMYSKGKNICEEDKLSEIILNISVTDEKRLSENCIKRIANNQLIFEEIIQPILSDEKISSLEKKVKTLEDEILKVKE